MKYSVLCIWVFTLTSQILASPESHLSETGRRDEAFVTNIALTDHFVDEMKRKDPRFRAKDHCLQLFKLIISGSYVSRFEFSNVECPEEGALPEEKRLLLFRGYLTPNGPNLELLEPIRYPVGWVGVLSHEEHGFPQLDELCFGRWGHECEPVFDNSGRICALELRSQPSDYSRCEK